MLYEHGLLHVVQVHLMDQELHRLKPVESGVSMGIHYPHLNSSTWVCDTATVAPV